MHEYSVSKEIVSEVRDVALEKNADAVNEVKLEIGELSHINLKQLKFCYETITKEDDLLEDSNLKTEKKEIKIACDCGYEGKVSDEEHKALSTLSRALKCPECGKGNPSIVEGEEIFIRDIKIVRE